MNRHRIENIRPTLLASAMLLLLSGLSAQAQDLRVLWIGNSYSIGSYPHVEALSAADPHTSITLVRAMANGRSWPWHFTNRFNAVYDGNSSSLSDKLTQHPYDVVILQNESLSATRLRDNEIFYAYGTNLATYSREVIGAAGNPNRNTNAQIRLFMTWARRADSGNYYAGYTPFDMQHEIRTNYNTLGQMTDAAVHAVGEAWERVYRVRPYGGAPGDFSLHVADTSHGDAKGYYLSALIHFEHLFGRSALGNPYKPASISSEDAAFLQDVAHQVVQEIPAQGPPPPAIELATNRVTIAEGQTGGIAVRLPEAPAGNVSVGIHPVSGNGGVRPCGATNLVFTPDTWSDWQSFALEALPDADLLNGTNTIRFSADGPYGSVYALALEEDTGPLSFGLPWAESFEASDPGILDGQRAWTAEPAAAGIVQNTVTHDGQQALATQQGRIRHTFTGDYPRVWFRWYAQPIGGEENPAMDADAAAVFWVATNGFLRAYNHTPVVALADSPVPANAWVEFVVGLNYSNQTWSLRMDGTLCATGLSFRSPQSAFSEWGLLEDGGTGWVDDLSATLANPYATGYLDTDLDGMPDWWEEIYGSGPTNLNADADDDLDGHSNLEEFIAGTHPMDAQSVFALEGVFIDADAVRLSWPSLSNRIYRIYQSVDLTAGFTPDIPDEPIPARPPTNVYTGLLQQGASPLFYRATVRLLQSED